jgi:hypothetical protein
MGRRRSGPTARRLRRSRKLFLQSPKYNVCVALSLGSASGLRHTIQQCWVPWGEALAESGFGGPDGVPVLGLAETTYPCNPAAQRHRCDPRLPQQQGRVALKGAIDLPSYTGDPDHGQAGPWHRPWAWLEHGR